MSRNASIELDFADGTYRFRLAIGQWEELDEKTNRGPEELLRMTVDGTWRPLHLREVIRLGLIGGGLESGKALALVKRYFDNEPLGQHVALVARILEVALIGAPDGERPGKAEGPGKEGKPRKGHKAGSRSPRSRARQPR